MPPDGERTIRLRVLPRRQRRTRFIVEGDQCIDYEGNEQAELPVVEALDKLATGNFELCESEQLTDRERQYLDAKCDPLWPAKHGQYPKFSDFQS
jgi:hypothetical protein